MKAKEVDISKSRMKTYYFSTSGTVFVVLAFLRSSEQSITGVTYMDDFDFESRYRDVHECDPTYWHPLHLPEHCAKMYETLISSKIGSMGPVRVVMEKKKPTYKSFITKYEIQRSVPKELSYDSLITYMEPLSLDFSKFYKPYYKRLSPYEKMMEMLRRDVILNPPTPIISNSPLFGPVTVYNQAISRRSESLIKKVANIYANVQWPTDDYFNSNYYGQLDIKRPVGEGDLTTEKNNDTTSQIEYIDTENIIKKLVNKQEGLEPAKSSGKHHHRHKPKVIEKVMPNGDVFTIIKQNT